MGYVLYLLFVLYMVIIGKQVCQKWGNNKTHFGENSFCQIGKDRECI